MINLQFDLTNPFSHRWNVIFNRAGPTPVENLAWEVEIFKDNTILSFAFQWTFRRDHAGIEVNFGFLGYSIHACIVDARHWNTRTNDWGKPTDDAD